MPALPVRFEGAGISTSASHTSCLVYSDTPSCSPMPQCGIIVRSNRAMVGLSGLLLAIAGIELIADYLIRDMTDYLTRDMKSTDGFLCYEEYE